MNRSAPAGAVVVGGAAGIGAAVAARQRAAGTAVVVWDVQGNGKTLVKANYGSYPWRPAANSALPGLNPNAETWARTYAWTDRNGDRAWRPGAEGPLTSQPGRRAPPFTAPVIYILPCQRDLSDMGGTMRLGLSKCKIVKGKKE